MMCADVHRKCAQKFYGRTPAQLFPARGVSLCRCCLRLGVCSSQADESRCGQLNSGAVEIMMIKSLMRLHPNGLAVASYRHQRYIMGGFSWESLSSLRPSLHSLPWPAWLRPNRGTPCWASALSCLPGPQRAARHFPLSLPVLKTEACTQISAPTSFSTSVWESVSMPLGEPVRAPTAGLAVSPTAPSCLTSTGCTSRV